MQYVFDKKKTASGAVFLCFVMGYYAAFLMSL